MKKTNYLIFLFWCLILASCGQEADVTPELKNQRGNPLCILDPFGNCIPQGGNGGGNGNNNPGFKVYMRGATSYSLNQGYSNNGFDWLAQGSVPNVFCEFGPSAVKYGNDLYTFYSRNTIDNGVPATVIAFSRSITGGSSWTNHTMDNSVSVLSTSATSAVEFENKIYLAYKQLLNNHTISVLTSNGTTGWGVHSSPVSHTENSSGGEPYLAVHNNELYLFFTNSAGRVFYKKKNASPSVTWGLPVDVTAEVNGSDVLSTGGVTAVSFNNTIHVIYKANSNYLLAANALSLGTPQGHYVNTAQTDRRPSVATDGTKLVLLYKSNTGGAVRYSTSSDGQSWIGNTYAVGDTSRPPYVISN